MKKECFKCKEIKLLKEFYAHPQMSDKHLGKCKTCAKNDVKLIRFNPKFRHKILLKDRKRSKTKARKAWRKKWMKEKQKTRKYRVAKYVTNKVRLAVNTGKLIKTNCSICGSSKRIQGHHKDYSKPLEVIWLCEKHHKEIHYKLNQLT